MRPGALVVIGLRPTCWRNGRGDSTPFAMRRETHIAQSGTIRDFTDRPILYCTNEIAHNGIKRGPHRRRPR